MIEECVRFTSERSLAELQQALALVARSFRGDYLTVPSDRFAAGRLRIDPESRTRYRLTCWPPAKAEAVLHAIGARESVVLPPGPYSAAECAVWQFTSAMDLESMRAAFGECERVGDSLRWATYDANRIEDVRWKLAKEAGAYVLELTYEANPHVEARWRELCGRASQLLAAWSAAQIVEPPTWTIAIERRSGHFAWSYVSDASLERQQELLADATHARWQLRESSHYGEYLAWSKVGPYAESIRLRVFEEGHGRFVIDLRWASEREGATIVDVEAWVLEQLLPAVGARDVEEAEGYD